MGGVGVGWFDKIDRQKKLPLPFKNTWGKIAPLTDTVGNVLPSHVLKTCLYVSVVFPQQL